MASQTVVRASVIAGMAVFYMMFLISVMKFFEADVAEAEAMPFAMKTTQSVTVPDQVVVVPDQYVTVPSFERAAVAYKSRTIVK
jgi:hypothetical protein